MMSMEALIARTAIVLGVFASLGAVSRTPNFVVHAPTNDIAKQVSIAAEHYRDKLAFEWLGKKFPRRWSTPCQITVRVGHVGAGGETKFTFHNGHVFGWKMVVQGSLERILDSVLPHEISHTVFACHFRRPLPRWADEGAATMAEHSSEKLRQRKMVEEILNGKKRIPLRKLLTIQEYPSNMQSILTLYAQGFSLADYLIQRGGKTRYLQFLEDAFRRSWDQAIQRHYKLDHIDALEKNWSNWVIAGSPELGLTAGQLLARNHSSVDRRTEQDVVFRSQTPQELDDASIQRGLPSQSGNKPLSAALQTGGEQDAKIALAQSRNRSNTSSQVSVTAPVRVPRGQELYAPDPRRMRNEQIALSRPPNATNRQLPSTEFISESIGRRRALNDGWIPVAPDLLQQAPGQYRPWNRSASSGVQDNR